MNLFSQHSRYTRTIVHQKQHVLAGTWLSQKKHVLQVMKSPTEIIKSAAPSDPMGAFPYPMILFWGVEVVKGQQIQVL